MIVALEGIDGSGKHTQSKRLADALNADLISFPRYKTPVGESIMRELQAPKMSPMEFQCMMLADKCSAATQIASRALTGNLVLDRYWMSGVAYGESDGLDRAWLIDIHQFLPQPDHWILLDVPVEESVKRRPERRDHYEKNSTKLARVRENYLFTWKAAQVFHPRKWHIILGDQAPEDVTKQIIDKLL